MTKITKNIGDDDVPELDHAEKFYQTLVEDEDS